MRLCLMNSAITMAIHMTHLGDLLGCLARAGARAARAACRTEVNRGSRRRASRRARHCWEDKRHGSSVAVQPHVVAHLCDGVFTGLQAPCHPLSSCCGLVIRRAPAQKELRDTALGRQECCAISAAQMHPAPLSDAHSPGVKRILRRHGVEVAVQLIMQQASVFLKGVNKPWNGAVVSQTHRFQVGSFLRKIVGQSLCPTFLRRSDLALGRGGLLLHRGWPISSWSVPI